MIDRFFKPDDRARIEAAVRSAEERSRGEIVPVVVEKCDGYPEARFRGAFIALALATLVVLVSQAPLTLAELALLQVAAALAGGVIALWDPVERLLAGRVERELAARERAIRAFHEHALHRTREGTGVLIFAALFEHQAVVLGDRGIDEKMGQEQWQHAVDALVAGLRRNDPASGFCSAIEIVGGTLAQHFPRSKDDAGNELDDSLRSPERDPGA
jgi:putative membrane protein